MSNDDYIKRSDALQTVEDYFREKEKSSSLFMAVETMCLCLIHKTPAADLEPKRKTGRWIIAGAFDDFYQCPECGEMWPIFSTIEWKCCPICECKIITNRPKGEDDGT